MKIYDFRGKKNLSGKRIKAARIDKRMSQVELAKRLAAMGVRLERDSISRIEAGTRIVLDYELVAIAKTLEIPVIALVDTIM